MKNDGQRIIITVLSILLALSIVSNIFLIQRLDLNGSGTDVKLDSESGTLDSDSDLETVGTPSSSEFGDYESAKDYKEIYDYVEKQFKDTVIGSIYTEYATNDLAVEEADMGSASTASGDLFSSTNTMTDSVDESDISKTDGNYIYNATDGEIFIFEIKNEVKAINSFIPDFVDPSDIIREIFLDKDILTVITEHTDGNGFDSDITRVLIYDISDRKNESLIDSYSQDGVFNTIRKVDDIIYLFTNKYLNKPSREKKDAILSDNIGEWFPRVNGKVVDSNCVYLPKSGSNTLVMSSFSQANPKNTIDAKVIVNDYSEIYVGDKGIYLYSTNYGNRQVLTISKLHYESGTISTGNAVSLRGTLNDKFAINEYENYLRVVATEYNDSTSNSLYVLDNDLKVCGQINNIANGEQLYSCRFLGDVGYFVTYRQTDPLFTVDLKDASNPKIVGELHIPGFSEYLHFWGEDKLLGIGYDADESGRTKGIKLSMFDISDPYLVKEESKLVLNSEDYAPGFYNYKAILAFAEGNIFGFSHISYDNDMASYSFFEYKEDGFNMILSEEISSDSINRARGHVVNDRLFLSNDTEVVELNR